MKTNTILVSLFFDTPDGKHYSYTGLVKAAVRGKKHVVDTNKIFKHVAGYEIPVMTHIVSI